LYRSIANRFLFILHSATALAGFYPTITFRV
jgi:hypothetical protein